MPFIKIIVLLCWLLPSLARAQIPPPEEVLAQLSADFVFSASRHCWAHPPENGEQDPHCLEVKSANEVRTPSTYFQIKRLYVLLDDTCCDCPFCRQQAVAYVFQQDASSPKPQWRLLAKQEFWHRRVRVHWQFTRLGNSPYYGWTMENGIAYRGSSLSFYHLIAYVDDRLLIAADHLWVGAGIPTFDPMEKENILWIKEQPMDITWWIYVDENSTGVTTDTDSVRFDPAPTAKMPDLLIELSGNYYEEYFQKDRYRVPFDIQFGRYSRPDPKYTAIAPELEPVPDKIIYRHPYRLRAGAKPPACDALYPSCL